MDGFVVIDKPAGMTSHDVVARCRRIFGQKRIGHSGTLDPDATGVLVVGLGRATRLMQFVTGLGKSYQAEMVLGMATSTQDASGEVIGRCDMSSVTLDDARAAASKLTGEIWQVPPMVSAVKVGGKRLHRLARQGVEVDRPARQVTISSFSVDALTCGDHPSLEVTVDCSSGTYVRTLASDLGEALGGFAHVRKLRRTAVGPWTVSDAVPLDELQVAHVRPAREFLPGLPRVTVTDAVAARVANGAVLEQAAVGVAGDGPWALLGPNGDLLAVYTAHRGGATKPVVVLGAAGA